MLVYEQHATDESEVILEALKKHPPTKPGEFRTVVLGDEDSTTMKRYLDSIFEGCFPTRAIESLPDEESANLCYLVLAELYRCAQRLLNAHYQFHILEEIVRITTLNDSQVFCPNAEVVNIIYSGSDTTSTQGRRLMAAIHVRHGSAELLTADYNPEFILNVAKESVATLKAWKESGESAFKDLIILDHTTCSSTLA